jgi:hypothetical protein
MIGTIGPDVARAAVALHRSHPAVPALAVLDTCMRQRTGRLGDFGAEIEPGSAFGDLLAEAFADGSPRQTWTLCQDPTTPAHIVSRLRAAWANEVLASFAARYGLKT